MKVIVGCDPLLSPLTGIGHYTKNLILGLQNHPDIEEVKLYAHGKFFGKDLLTAERSYGTESPSLVQRSRARLALSPYAVRAYGLIEPKITAYKLSRLKDHVFHAPNFLLPNFSGRKVVTIHDLSTIKMPEFHPPARVELVNKAIQYAVKNADHIITDSEFVKAELLDFYDISESKITPIHLGVDGDYHPRSQQECYATLARYDLCFKDYILFVSTIEPRKNIKRLLAAYRSYRQKNPAGPRLVLIGDPGWNSREEHMLIQELASTGEVKYLGYVEQSDLPMLMAGARVFIFPSLYEGFGLPVAEAMRSGVPVLTSRDSAMQEFAGEDAVLVDPLSVDDIADGIELVLDGSWESKAVNSIRAKREFDWTQMVRQLVAIYAN
jgi:glycosyltransferase involved in cell wall biosynthesis